MPVCYNCNSKQLHGTAFCSACGASLIDERHQETTLHFQQVVDLPQTAPAINAAPAAAGRAPTMALVIVSSGKRFAWSDETALLGRRDVAHGIDPTVDLGAEGGYDAGVSRRHAQIVLHDGAYHLEDLDSANGTFLNGRRLAPHRRVTLSHGDEVQCATLRMRAEIG